MPLAISLKPACGFSLYMIRAALNGNVRSPFLIENGDCRRPDARAGRRFSRSCFNPSLETLVALDVGMAKAQLRVIADRKLVTPMSTVVTVQ